MSIGCFKYCVECDHARLTGNDEYTCTLHDCNRIVWYKGVPSEHHFWCKLAGENIVGGASPSPSAKKVTRISPDGMMKTYNTVSAAAQDNHLGYLTIMAYLSGSKKRKDGTRYVYTNQLIGGADNEQR